MQPQRSRSKLTLRDGVVEPVGCLEPWPLSSSGSGASLLGTGVKLCDTFAELFFWLFAPLAVRCSDARSAGEEAGSALRAVDGVEGEDFWKKPRIDFWFFIFCVLDVVRLSGPDEGVVATVGEEAAPFPFAIADQKITALQD